MKFKDFIKETQDIEEALDTYVDYTIDEHRKDVFMTSAKIGDRKIVFRADKDYIDQRGGEIWEVVFLQTSLSGGSINYDATGQGNELEVFAMVKSSMEDFIKDYDPPRMIFSADKENGSSRAALYSRMLKRFLTGYTVEEFHQPDRTVFRLTKK